MSTDSGAVSTQVERVIDSLLIRDGHAICLDRHRERFARSIREAFGEQGLLASDCEAVWTDLSDRVPREGDWFPLIEAVWKASENVDDTTGTVSISTELRPAPPLRANTALTTVADRRLYPQLKGADAEVTAEDRHYAVTHGGDDALYINREGRLLEAANGAVIGWNGYELVVPRAANVLESTTVATLIAEVESGRPGVPHVEVVYCAHGFEISDVEELWYLNALHGITPVHQLDGAPLWVNEDRLTVWQHITDHWWQPL